MFLSDFDFQGFMFFVFGSFAFCHALYFLKKRNRVLAAGNTSHGKVTGSKLSFRNRTIRKVPVIRFTTKDNKTIESDSISSPLFSSYKKGMDVEVIYDERDPSFFFIKDNTGDSIWQWGYLAISAAFAIFGLLELIGGG